VDHINPVCSVPSVEVLLSVVVVATTVHFIVPPALLREEIRVLLTMEAIVVLIRMEAPIVASELLRVVMHTIVKGTTTAESILLVRMLVVTGVVRLVFLHRQVRVLCAWYILSRDIVIVSSKLIIPFFVKIVSLRVEEVTGRENIETILVILARSVLDLLSCELPHLWRLFHSHWLVNRMAFL